MENVVSIATRPARISVKVRAAIDARIRRGLSLSEAAKEAGMSRNGFTKALKRQPVQDLLRSEQAAFVAEVEASRAVFKARAFEVALELMLTAKSEAIRARMAEFLASDGKNSGAVNVHVDARQVHGGYEYVRPGQEVVRIEEKASKESLDT